MLPTPLTHQSYQPLHTDSLHAQLQFAVPNIHEHAHAHTQRNTHTHTRTLILCLSSSAVCSPSFRTACLFLSAWMFFCADTLSMTHALSDSSSGCTTREAACDV